MDDWGDTRAEEGSLGAKNNTVTASFTMGEAGRRCSWCYGLICVCLSPIFSILSFFDWLEQWMDVGLEGGGEEV